ncbi:MAG: sugar ABC transporter substrate-binding protein [Chloroflexota bacterium]|nr:sugar ABC transporter substrate-binding protein [Chloroflexota bacterium]
MKKLSLLLVLVVILLSLPLSISAQDLPFSGRVINFLTIQPHAVASRAAAELFEAETGADVQVLVVPFPNITEKALLDVASGAGEYDVVEIWYTSLGQLASNGVLVDLTEWWDANAEAINAEDFAPTIVEPYTLWDGKRWALPYDGDTHVIWFNTALLEQYGQEIPTTWEEYATVAQAITEAGSADGIYGAAIQALPAPIIQISSFANRLGGFGGSFFDAEGNPSINTPEAVDALQNLLDTAPYALPTPASVGFDETIAAFSTGNVAIAEFWTDFGQIVGGVEGSTVGDNLAVRPILVGGDNETPRPALNAGFAVGISTLAQDPEVAQAFLEFLARPDINVTLNTIVGGLDPTRLSTFDNPVYIEHVGQDVADAARAALLGATAWGNTPEWAEQQEVLNNNLSAAIVGDLTAQEALDATQAEWERIHAGN